MCIDSDSFSYSYIDRLRAIIVKQKKKGHETREPVFDDSKN